MPPANASPHFAHDEGPGEAVDEDDRLSELRGQVQLLTSQFYKDRQQWLEEKRQLQGLVTSLSSSLQQQQSANSINNALATASSSQLNGSLLPSPQQPGPPSHHHHQVQLSAQAQGLSPTSTSQAQARLYAAVQANEPILEVTPRSHGGASTASSMISSIDDTARLEDSFNSSTVAGWNLALQRASQQPSSAISHMGHAASISSLPSPGASVSGAAAGTGTGTGIGMGAAMAGGGGAGGSGGGGLHGGVMLSPSSDGGAAAVAESMLMRQELAALRAQLQDYQNKSSQWSAERSSLQRQVDALMSMAQAAGSDQAEETGALAAQLQALEDERAHLQAQLAMLLAEQQLQMTASRKSSVSVSAAAAPPTPGEQAPSGPPALSQSRSSGGSYSSGQAGAAASASAAAAPAGTATPDQEHDRDQAVGLEASLEALQQHRRKQQQAADSSGQSDAAPASASAATAAVVASGGTWGLTMTQSVSLPALLREKAMLEKEVARYREECVAVPKAQYTELCTVHSQKSFLECELGGLRAELADAERAREAVEEELALLQGRDVMLLPAEEYERLLRLQAEARAREARAAADACSTIKLSSTEHARLLAAIKERDVLAEQLAAMHSAQHAAASVEGAAAHRVERLEAQLRDLRLQNAALSAECQALSSSLAGAQAGLGDMEALQAALAAAEASAAALQQEQVMWHHRQRTLESEIAALKDQVTAAKADRERLYRDLGAAQDTCVRAQQAQAEAEAARNAAEAAAAASQQEARSLTEELVSVKMALAQAREMEVLFKRQVFKTKVQLHGLPTTEQLAAAMATEMQAQQQEAAGSTAAWQLGAGDAPN